MEKHKCKLCFRSFSNGRALGGHMRSHMMNLPVPPKPNESPPMVQLSFEAESASSPSSSASEDSKALCYGLRENPKRSFRLADPEFADTGSVILQDRESETESSKNPTRRRSIRDWKLGAFDHHHNNNHQQQQTMKRIKLAKLNNKNESLSSVSDTTTEEDVAFCLMMLSRDKWKRLEDEEEEEEEEEEQNEEEAEDEDEDDEEEEESDESEEELKSSKATAKVRGGRYKCETCNKVFRSYQALGGHRASHKKIKAMIDEREFLERDNKNINNNNNNGRANSVAFPVTEKKIHECPVCFRVFASGQALGGHKRTHVIGSAAVAAVAAATATATLPGRNSAKYRDSLIDLNLPAPVDDDDVSQIEDSAVSDAEFVKSR